MSNDMERERFDHLTRVEAAAEKLVKCKGRYHSELNMIALAALFGVKLPPPVATPAPAVERYHPDASHVRPDYRDGWNACCDAFERAAAAEAQAERNQCDGCAAGMPKRGSIHIDAAGHAVMSCQRGRYAPPVAAPPAAGAERTQTLLADVRLFLELLPNDLGRSSLNGMRAQLQYALAAPSAPSDQQGGRD